MHHLIHHFLVQQKIRSVTKANTSISLGEVFAILLLGFVPYKSGYIPEY